MSAFSVRATFDGKELVQGFKDVKKEVEGLSVAGEDAKQSLDQMLQHKNSTTNYKRQLSQITAELTDLSVNFSKLSDVEKRSPLGQAMSKKIDELTVKARELKGVMDSVSQSVKTPIEIPVQDFGDQWAEMQKQSEQTYAKFESIQKISAGVASGFAAVQGAAALLGKENEDLQKALLKVQSAMAIAQGIGGIKDLVEGFKQAKLAFKGAAVAAEGATVAQNGLNKAMMANPYVAIAAAVVALGVAFVSYSKKLVDASDAEIEHKAALLLGTEAEKKRRQAISESTGEIIGKYKLLQAEWNSLKTNQERTDWIEDNQSAFEDLGLSINGVVDAQKMLVEWSSHVVTALKLQAEASALSEIYKDSYKEAYTRSKEIENEMKAAEERWQSGAEFTTGEFQKYNISAGERQTEPIVNDDTNWFVKSMIAAASTEGGPSITSEVLSNRVNSTGAARIRNEILTDLKQQQADIWEETNAILEDTIAKQKEADDAAKKAGIASKGKGTKGKSTNTKKTLADERTAYINEDRELDKLYSEGLISYQDYLTGKKSLQEKYIQNIIALEGDITEEQAAEIRNAQQLSAKFQDIISLEQKRLKLEQDKVKSQSDYETAIKHINTLEEDGILDATEARAQEIAAAKKYYNFLISNWGNLTEKEKENAKAIKATIDAYNSVPKGKTVAYRDSQQGKADTVVKEFEAGLITEDVARQAIDAINKDLESIGLKPLNIEIEDSALLEFERNYETTMSKVDSWSSVVQSVADSFGSIVNALNDENTALGALGATLTDNEKAWLSWGVSSMATVAQTLPQIASLIVASQAQSLAQGTASAAGLPFPANIAAIASIIAMIVSIFASLPKFAAGGIIPGSSHIGDMNLARVNGGEMILNTRQQANLFNMLDHNRLPQSSASGEVTFRIQGDTLVGVIDNYNRKRSRI